MKETNAYKSIYHWKEILGMGFNRKNCISSETFSRTMTAKMSAVNKTNTA